MVSNSCHSPDEHREPYVAMGDELSQPVPEMSYRRLFETAGDGILILDAASGRILDVNPFMERMSGRSKAELLDRQLWQIGVFADIDANRAAFDALGERDTVHYEHLPFLTKAGRTVDVELVCHAYVACGRRVAQCNIRDITERRRLEKRIREQAAALAALNRRKDEFFAILSHELRNPLSAISNAVNLHGQDSCKAACHEKASAIVKRQAKRLTLLIDDVLEIARATTGHMHLRRERADLRVIIEYSIDAIQPLIARRKHDLSVLLPDEPVWLNVDSCRMEQVVTNLLTNAAKYALEAGHISVVVERERDEVVLRVRDTGIGISPKLLPRVFDLFTQGNTALDRPEGGLGIGLTVVQRLVELHGGTVTASSPGLGLGSEFVVRLPATSPAVPRAAVPRSSVTTEVLGEKRRLLIVDDDTDAADTLAEFLRVFGHEVSVAYSGISALEKAASDPPDAVLLDIALPDMSGYEIATRLRQNAAPDVNRVCLIATTGSAMSSDRARITKAGFDHHLVKPVDPRKLQRLVARLGSARTPQAYGRDPCSYGHPPMLGV